MVQYSHQTYLSWGIHHDYAERVKGNAKGQSYVVYFVICPGWRSSKGWDSHGVVLFRPEKGMCPKSSSSAGKDDILPVCRKKEQ